MKSALYDEFCIENDDLRVKMINDVFNWSIQLMYSTDLFNWSFPSPLSKEAMTIGALGANNRKRTKDSSVEYHLHDSTANEGFYSCVWSVFGLVLVYFWSIFAREASTAVSSRTQPWPRLLDSLYSKRWILCLIWWIFACNYWAGCVMGHFYKHLETGD